MTNNQGSSDQNNVNKSGRDDLSFHVEDRRAVNCFILNPLIQQNNKNPHLQGTDEEVIYERSAEEQKEEIVGLALAIELEIKDYQDIRLLSPKPATLFGSGKVDEIGSLIKSVDAELVIINNILTPIQQRNLEREWGVKILDRTGLILEIFGRRAHTKEGRLQVELAHLTYQKGRLVRSWTHLERQRGGVGFMGGPGETQIEADRRHIQARIKSLETQIDKVKKTRTLHRKNRQKIPYPIVALVGYTNAGKSTLFNLLAGSHVMAKDLLFATLDPTLREISLPGGRKILLSDTVGFISELPTNLIAAFRATLEEVLEADLILHVRDIAHPTSEQQAYDVRNVLSELGVSDEKLATCIEVWNKVDLLSDHDKEIVRTRARGKDDSIPVSALSGEGIDHLLSVIEEELGQNEKMLSLCLGPDKSSELYWFYENSEVLSRIDKSNGDVFLEVRLDEKSYNRAITQFKDNII